MIYKLNDWWIESVSGWVKDWAIAGNKIDARPLAIASWIICGRVLPIYHSPTLASSSFIVLKSFKVNLIKNLKYLEFFNKIQRIIIAHFVYVYCASACASNLHTFPVVGSLIFSVCFIDLRKFFLLHWQDWRCHNTISVLSNYFTA